MNLRMPVGVVFVIVAMFELLMLAMAVLGTLSGGVMTALAVAGEMRGDDAAMGPVLLVAYTCWSAACAISGIGHLGLGIQLLRGRSDKWLYVVGALLGLPPMITIYCVPTSIIAIVVGGVAAVIPATDDGRDLGKME